ncbi:N-acetyltransferase [Bradyrhizobium sp. SSBR45G]|uniref:GNAT family N-acetyltransferase n=1 Tax=unclassified Bradyrhizobium TaxID=2631580 RepID=UPI0023429A63|nr:MULTISPECIES: GNAT family N-acetyltransferase [unclassified Bradyrhizobium]GLH77476.1 N-acetyltransferase [Bradyrhizobium sp. SSBR45G]GLH84418.1 N-acetyltransferase [Bradyrhizobium sp. SSBR45R]
MASQILRRPRRFRINEVDAYDPDIMEVLKDLHARTFLDRAPLPDFEIGHWWITTETGRPTAFAGLIPSALGDGIGYLSRVGVLRERCGYGLQRRMIRAIEQRARPSGLYCIVSDTTDNIVSANNFIRCGYSLFQPVQPWAWGNSLYWRKMIGA